MIAPKRRERQLDPFVRETTRLRARDWDTCDCPCHWWPDVEHSPCCAMVGMRYIGGEDAYVPWPDRDQP